MDRREFLKGIAKRAFLIGLTPVPIKTSIKRPYLPGWNKTEKKDALRRFDREIDKGAADGISILTGEPSGVIVVDIDDVEFWDNFVKDKDLPKTFTVQSPSGGRHIYFKYDDRVSGLKNSNRIFGKKVDFRTNGGVIVFPGTKTASGGAYLVAYPENINELDKLPVADMPDWLFDWIDSYQKSIKH